MNKKLGYVVAFSAVIAMSSCSKKLGDFASDYFTTNPNPLEVVGEKVPATVTANIPEKFFVKNAEVTVTPYLVYDGTETASHAYSFQGENVRGNAPVISYKNGGTVTIPVSFDYVPAMAKSDLELAFTVNQGSKQYVLPRVKVATGVIGTAYLADAGTVAPALLPDGFQRIINEKYAADIMFLINVANIRPDQLTTSQMEQLWGQINEANAAANREIKDINIKSYASPDGGYDFNYNLAENREKNTNAYIQKQLAKDKVTDFGEITKQFTAEDWEGFKKLVEASNIQDKQLVLSVLGMYNEPEEREAKLRELASVFPVLADQILPQLRYSRITASIDVIGRSDEEILAVLASTPNSLSVDEILYAATLTPDNNQKMAAYKAATVAYPNDYRGWNDLGLTQYVAGDFAAAANSFNKAKSLAPNVAEIAMNLGLIDLANGNYSNAKNLFGTAAGAPGLGAALGTYYLKMGDNNAAAKAMADVKSNNAALAQILTSDYSKASSILNSLTNPDAMTYYLKAIVGARTNNANMVTTNLAKAVQMDKTLAAKALNDLEFANFNISSLF
ncbi:MAG: hypothetical protein K2K37_05430 [Muribaculaceae bacterium]|nr:hypothetical protein [Muribaculaceae bacterium]